MHNTFLMSLQQRAELKKKRRTCPCLLSILKEKKQKTKPSISSTRYNCDRSLRSIGKTGLFKLIPDSGHLGFTQTQRIRSSWVRGKCAWRHIPVYRYYRLYLYTTYAIWSTEDGELPYCAHWIPQGNWVHVDIQVPAEQVWLPMTLVASGHPVHIRNPIFLYLHRVISK